MIRSRPRTAVLACVLVAALSGAAAAIASDTTPPRVVSPADGGELPAGHVVLIVDDPGLSGIAAPIYLVVAHTRRVDERGHLTFQGHRCGPRCDYGDMSRWAGHRGLWIYRATRNHVAHYWAATPGTYYWQVYHYVPGCRPVCVQYSAIHDFRVVR